VIFNAGNTVEMVSDLKNLFCMGEALNAGLVGTECLYYLKSYSWILVISVLGSTDIPKRVYAKIKGNPVVSKVSVVVEPVVLLLLLLLCTAYLIDGSFNPFLYFRF
jgi:alginate O-acetyltransferase complex protein AlgI